MEPKYLIDTNIIIYYSENKLPTQIKSFIAGIIDNEPYISVVNKIELLVFSSVSKEIIEFTETANIIGLTDDVVSQTIALRKQYKTKLPDAIIATTAITHNFTLVTRNMSDFKNIDSLLIADLRY